MDAYISAKDNRMGEWQSLEASYKEAAQTLQNEWKKLEKGHEDLESKKVALALKNGGSNVNDSDILDINAGGQIVRVRRGTLTQQQGSQLEAMFSGRWEKQLHGDPRGRIFLDVNPACFKKIVAHLNECNIAPPESQPGLPLMDSDNQPFLDSLLTALGLHFTRKLDSSILTDPNHARALTGFLSDSDMGTELDLLYRGTRDGMTASSFHQKCDNQGPTVTVVKSTNNYIFGGFSDKPWTSPGDGHYVQSDKAFLFGLTCHGGNKPEKLVLNGTHRGEAIHRNQNFGPTFGGGHDLVVLNGNPYSYLGASYSSSENNRYFFTGSQSFEVSEIEIFGVCVPSAQASPQRPVQPWQKLKFDAFPDNIQKSFEAEKIALLQASNELSALQHAFTKEEAAVQVFCQGDKDDIVLLNVSGQSMAVKPATLARYPNSVLCKQFVDPNWNTPSRKAKTHPSSEWNAEQVVAWSKKIKGLSMDVSDYFKDVTGAELLVLNREDIKELGIPRQGTVALVATAIQNLCDEEEDTSATFIEHCDYCFGKIIDHMRLQAMQAMGTLGVKAPHRPEIREPDKQRFKGIVEYYFPMDDEDFLS